MSRIPILGWIPLSLLEEKEEELEVSSVFLCLSMRKCLNLVNSLGIYIDWTDGIDSLTHELFQLKASGMW